MPETFTMPEIDREAPVTHPKPKRAGFYRPKNTFDAEARKAEIHWEKELEQIRSKANNKSMKYEKELADYDSTVSVVHSPDARPAEENVGSEDLCLHVQSSFKEFENHKNFIHEEPVNFETTNYNESHTLKKAHFIDAVISVKLADNSTKLKKSKKVSFAEMAKVVNIETRDELRTYGLFH